MKKIVLVIGFCLLVGMGCNEEKEGLHVTQTTSISNNSDIENCDIKFDLTTYLWLEGKSILSYTKYEISYFDLDEVKKRQKKKALGIARCWSALKRVKD